MKQVSLIRHDRVIEVNADAPFVLALTLGGQTKSYKAEEYEQAHPGIWGCYVCVDENAQPDILVQKVKQ